MMKAISFALLCLLCLLVLAAAIFVPVMIYNQQNPQPQPELGSKLT